MEEARADDIDCASAGRSPTEPGSEGVNPIKSFVEARRQSVSDQLAGSQRAMCLTPAASTRATSPTRCALPGACGQTSGLLKWINDAGPRA